MTVLVILLAFVSFFAAGVLFDQEVFSGEVARRISSYRGQYIDPHLVNWLAITILTLVAVVVLVEYFAGGRSAPQRYRRLHQLRMVRNLTWVTSLLVLLGCVSLYLEVTPLDRSTVAQLAFVGLFSSAVGYAELISRYSDDPRRLLASDPTAIYVCVNLAAGVGALALTKHFQVFPPGENRAIFEVLLASFGAIAFFRTSFFTARVGDTDVGIGPSTLLKSLLDTSDLMTDREQAVTRAGNVSAIMPDVDFEKAKIALPALCFLLVANAPPEQQQKVGEQISKLAADNGMEPATKSLLLGVYLLRQVGALVLAQAVETLGSQIMKAPAGQPSAGARSAPQPRPRPAAGDTETSRAGSLDGDPGEAVDGGAGKPSFQRSLARWAGGVFDPPRSRRRLYDIDPQNPRVDAGLSMDARDDVAGTPMPATPGVLDEVAPEIPLERPSAHILHTGLGAAVSSAPPAPSTDADTLAGDVIVTLQRICSRHFGPYTMTEGLQRQLRQLADHGFVSFGNKGADGIPLEGSELSEHVMPTEVGAASVEPEAGSSEKPK